jgi:hypothetical protein
MYCYGAARPVMESCTLYGNGILITGTSSLTLERSIVAFGPGAAVICEGDESSVDVKCSDIAENAGGNWTGCIGSQVGESGNISADPMFCDASIRDFTIDGQSPCSPVNSPEGCGLIGALPIACGITDVASEDATPAELRPSVSPNPVWGVAEFVFRGVGPRVLAIFDSQGRLVDRLSGSDGRWVWTPGSSAPAGVYFARLDGGGVTGEAVKFLYLR